MQAQFNEQMSVFTEVLKQKTPLVEKPDLQQITSMAAEGGTRSEAGESVENLFSVDYSTAPSLTGTEKVQNFLQSAGFG
jgi:hypothetical protein